VELLFEGQVPRARARRFLRGDPGPTCWLFRFRLTLPISFCAWASCTSAGLLSGRREDLEEICSATADLPLRRSRQPPRLLPRSPANRDCSQGDPESDRLAALSTSVRVDRRPRHLSAADRPRSRPPAFEERAANPAGCLRPLLHAHRTAGVASTDQRAPKGLHRGADIGCATVLALLTDTVRRDGPDEAALRCRVVRLAARPISAVGEMRYADPSPRVQRPRTSISGPPRSTGCGTCASSLSLVDVCEPRSSK
jgi:hypothetical protein